MSAISLYVITTRKSSNGVRVPVHSRYAATWLVGANCGGSIHAYGLLRGGKETKRLCDEGGKKRELSLVHMSESQAIRVNGTNYSIKFIYHIYSILNISLIVKAIKDIVYHCVTSLDI